MRHSQSQALKIDIARVKFNGWLVGCWFSGPTVPRGTYATGWSALRGSLSKESYPVFMGVSEKNTEN